MKKSDLRTGMVVKTRGGDYSKVLLNTENGDIFAGTEEKDVCVTWCPMESYNENLTRISDVRGDCDIVEVYGIGSNNRGASVSCRGDLIWKREEEKIVLTLDGVEYSEETLRSLIKKAVSKC